MKCIVKSRHLIDLFDLFSLQGARKLSEAGQSLLQATHFKELLSVGLSAHPLLLHPLTAASLSAYPSDR